MAQKTYCPHCGTVNLVKNQLIYIDLYGTHVFKCQMCNRVFSDISICESEQNIETLLTNQKQEENG